MAVGLAHLLGSIAGMPLPCVELSHVRQGAAMSELMILKEKLIKDPLFRSLFNKANDMQEAIKVASLYGIRLSIEDVTTHRKELRTVIGRQSFHLDFARPSDASWSWWGGGEEGGASGGGGCSHYGGDCSCF